MEEIFFYHFIPFVLTYVKKKYAQQIFYTNNLSRRHLILIFLTKLQNNKALFLRRIYITLKITLKKDSLKIISIKTILALIKSSLTFAYYFIIQIEFLF